MTLKTIGAGLLVLVVCLLAFRVHPCLLDAQINMADLTSVIVWESNGKQAIVPSPRGAIYCSGAKISLGLLMKGI